MAPRRVRAGARSGGAQLKSRRRGVVPAEYPLVGGRVFELGWSIFRFGWRQIYGALAVCLAPAYALSIAVEIFFGQRLADWIAAAASAAQAGQRRPEPPPEFVLDVAANAIAAVTMFVASLIGTAAVVAIVVAAYSGSFESTATALRIALRRLPALIGAQLLYFVGVFFISVLGLTVAGVLFLGGGLLTFVGVVVLVGALGLGLFFAVRLSLTTVAIVAEGIGGGAGVNRSWRLVADNGWRLLGYLVLVALVGTAVGYAFAPIVLTIFPFASGSTADLAAHAVIGVIPTFVLAPLGPVILTLVYFDLRWRHGERVPLPGGGETDGRQPV